MRRNDEWRLLSASIPKEKLMNLDNSFAVQVLQQAEEETQGWKMMIGGKWSTAGLATE